MPQLSTTTTQYSNIDASDHLRAFEHHGVELTERGRQSYGDCPMCGASGKFTVEPGAGLWRCFVCSRSGNPLTFLQQLHEVSARGSVGWHKELAADRKLMRPATVEAWGCCRSAVDGTWMVPGYSVRGDLVQLYRRVEVRDEDGSWSKVLMPTPGVWPDGKVHTLHMPSGDYDASRQQWFFAEGPWDGMALWEAARAIGQLADANVVAVPGCSVWQESWTEVCRGKDVVLPYDNDHPRDRNGTVTMAGRDGARRAAGKLAGVAKSVSWVCWGGGGYDASLPDGFDVRDAVSRGVSKCRA